MCGSSFHVATTPYHYQYIRVAYVQGRTHHAAEMWSPVCMHIDYTSRVKCVLVITKTNMLGFPNLHQYKIPKHAGGDSRISLFTHHTQDYHTYQSSWNTKLSFPSFVITLFAAEEYEVPLPQLTLQYRISSQWLWNPCTTLNPQWWSTKPPERAIHIIRSKSIVRM